jgi:hypothetical protein
MGKASERHGRRADFDGTASGESLTDSSLAVGSCGAGTGVFEAAGAVVAADAFEGMGVVAGAFAAVGAFVAAGTFVAAACRRASRL